jgi:hypothetical protein
VTCRHEDQQRRIFGRGDSSLLVQPRPCRGQKRELGYLPTMVWKGSGGVPYEGDQEGDRCVFLFTESGVDMRRVTYFFDLVSSNTSNTCSTRLFAVRSSLPTVTRTGSRWNEAASFRTESGHVALTRRFCERPNTRTYEQRFHVHIRVCRSSPSVVYPIMVRMSFSKPLSSIRSASSNTRYVTLQRMN